MACPVTCQAVLVDLLVDLLDQARGGQAGRVAAQA
jgi:hypothetical protein